MKALEQRICADCKESKPLLGSYSFNDDGTQSDTCRTCTNIAEQEKKNRGNLTYLFNKSRCADQLLDLQLKKELNPLKYMKL